MNAHQGGQPSGKAKKFVDKEERIARLEKEIEKLRASIEAMCRALNDEQTEGNE
jgi:phage host-nuclease inhibitor protein Gam